MPVVLNQHDLAFPSLDHVDEHGIIALGGDLRPERILAAYSLGIFPWPHEGYPLLWFCPDPRFVLKPQDIQINRSLKKAVLKSKLVIKADSDFLGVIQACQRAQRPDQNSTWITDDIIRAYHRLFELGYAHSVEAFEDGALVGGLYGLSIGSIFFGESMFSHASNASKICFVSLLGHLQAWNFSLIDCQAQTNHLGGFGARFITRADFLEQVALSTKSQTRLGPWQFYLTPKEAFELCRARHMPD